MSYWHSKQGHIREDKRQRMRDGIPKHTDSNAMEQLEWFFEELFGCKANRAISYSPLGIFSVHTECVPIEGHRLKIDRVNVYVFPWEDRYSQAQLLDYRFFSSGEASERKLHLKERKIRIVYDERNFETWDEGFLNLIRNTRRFMSLLDKWSRTRKGLLRSQMIAIAKATKQRQRSSS